jgi:hypothetical protein
VTEHEIRRRFRLALAGYLVLAAACIAGIAVNYEQQRQIRSSQKRLTATVTLLVRRDCLVVTRTAGVFVDFIRKEIALRAARSRDPRASPAVRAFDRAEVDYWQHSTLPELAQAFEVNCGQPG